MSFPGDGARQLSDVAYAKARACVIEHRKPSVAFVSKQTGLSQWEVERAFHQMADEELIDGPFLRDGIGSKPWRMMGEGVQGVVRAPSRARPRKAPAKPTPDIDPDSERVLRYEILALVHRYAHFTGAGTRANPFNWCRDRIAEKVREIAA
jgi:hypothetical protein